MSGNPMTMNRVQRGRDLPLPGVWWVTAALPLGEKTAAWSLVAGRLERRNVWAPPMLVLAGVPTGSFTHSELAETLDSQVAQHTAEVVLAVLLFVDATELPDGWLFGKDPASVARALLIALPLSLAATVLLGHLRLPVLPVAVLLIIACIIVPPGVQTVPVRLRGSRVSGLKLPLRQLLPS